MPSRYFPSDPVLISYYPILLKKRRRIREMIRAISADKEL
jgi:hypothetical protein